MAVWHEVHCDWNVQDADNLGRPACFEMMNENPAGWSVSEARRQAKAMGFRNVDGEDICPACWKRKDQRA